MFKWIAIATVLATIAGTGLDYLVRRKRRAAPQPPPRFPKIEMLVVAMTAVGFLVLAITGFCGATFLSRPLHGYWTIVHVSASGMFATGIACLAVMRGEAYGLGNAGRRFPAGMKWCFWLLAASTLVLILSILVPMLRLLGTPAQSLAIDIHRYAALVSLIAAIVYAHLARSIRAGE